MDILSFWLTLPRAVLGMLWLVYIFGSDASIVCPLFYLVRTSVVHSPSSVIRDPRYGNVSTCSSCSFWMSMRHTMPSLAMRGIPWSCRRWWVGCIRGTNSISFASEMIKLCKVFWQVVYIFVPSPSTTPIVSYYSPLRSNRGQLTRNGRKVKT